MNNQQQVYTPKTLNRKIYRRRKSTSVIYLLRMKKISSNKYKTKISSNKYKTKISSNKYKTKISSNKFRKTILLNKFTRRTQRMQRNRQFPPQQGICNYHHQNRPNSQQYKQQHQHQRLGHIRNQIWQESDLTTRIWQTIGIVQ